MFIKTISIFLFFGVALGLACSGQPVGQSNGSTSTSGGAIRLQGSGSTFVKPMMDKWTSEYGISIFG